MADSSVPLFFLLLGIVIKGEALIETEETVWAAVGDQASLSCRLSGNKEVLQVTWQKVLPDGEMNLATYTKKFGSRVSADMEEKMDLQHKDLRSCSMVIRKVTEQDEGCYRCLFNTYPKGALIGRTCLRLYELHGPVLDVSRSSSPAGSVVSCSATGRPAPTVTLTAPQQNLSLSLYNTTNSNGTVTVTTTALLSASSSTQVGCSVSVLSAAPRELLLTVPGPSHTSDHGLNEQPVLSFDERQEPKDLTVTLVIVIFVMVALFCGLAIIAKRRLKIEKHRDPERNKTPLKSPGMQSNKTPSQTSTNEMRQRTSTKKSQRNNSHKASSLVAKKLFTDDRPDGSTRKLKNQLVI